ncbi:MAG: hypothetical protein ACI82N_001360, partial [Maricaulis sp.]
MAEVLNLAAQTRRPFKNGRIFKFYGITLELSC